MTGPLRRNAPREPAGRNPKPRILLVDDERIITSALGCILTHEGYETAAAYSGEEAVEVARSFSPDFILSDVFMGRMNGIEAAQLILSFLPRCKVLFLSGHASHAEALGEARARGYDFELLVKPVSPAELLRRISIALSPPTAGEPQIEATGG